MSSKKKMTSCSNDERDLSVSGDSDRFNSEQIRRLVTPAWDSSTN